MEWLLQRPRPETTILNPREFTMATHNITNGANAPQPRGVQSNFLADLDQPAAETFLSVSEKAASPRRSPFSGLRLSQKYDPTAVRELVNELWPARVMGHRGVGPNELDRLPVVMYLLPNCDPEYGNVFNLSEAFRILKEDQELRSQLGFSDPFPGYKVFNETHKIMVCNWKRFQKCAASSEVLESLRARGTFGESSQSEESSPFRGALEALGWRGKIPPLYREEPGGIRVIRSVGLPRGRAGRSNVESDGRGTEVTHSGEAQAKSPAWRYPRDWRGYNEAQTHESQDFKALLGGLSDLVNIIEILCKMLLGYDGHGYSLGTVIFSVVYKAYFGVSGRRFEGPLKEAARQGYIRNAPGCAALGGANQVWVPSPSNDPIRIPHFNTVSNFLKSTEITPLLLELVTVTSRPLRSVENFFAVDGTAMKLQSHGRILDVRPTGERGSEANAQPARKGKVKLHLVVGVRSNTVARVAVSPWNESEISFFRGLMSETVRHFQVDTVAADMGYSSVDSHRLGDDLGFEVLIPRPSNTRVPPDNDGSAWARNFRYHQDHPDEFRARYGLRNDAESTNSALKRLLDEVLHTMEYDTQVNEALAKVLAYNVIVLAREVRMRDLALDLPSEARFLEDCIGRMGKERRSHSSERAA